MERNAEEKVDPDYLSIPFADLYRIYGAVWVQKQEQIFNKIYKESKYDI